ncbi:MAG: hypothetical protein WDM90_18530 [Ferruginibacter sp.]
MERLPLNSSSTAYYLAKERGAVFSLKGACDMTRTASSSITAAIPTLQTVSINGKSLVKYSYGNGTNNSMVNYFLRLPDGGPTGNGYAATGNASIQKLKLGTISSIASIDGANTYTSYTT